MASKDKKSSKGDSTEVSVNRQDDNGIPQAPDGFEDVGAIDGIQTWFRPKVGAVVHGRLMGRHERRSGRKQAFYQVKLISPATGIQGKGDDAEMIEIGKGEILNVNETKTLESLHSLSADDGVYDIHITVLEKITLGNENTFWRMRVQKKVLRAPTFSPDVSGKQESSSLDMSDIPF